MWAAEGGVKTVNCDKGKTIRHALEESGSNPITIMVKGTCNESVQISRPGVTLMAAPGGGTVVGSDPNSPALLIASEDTVIDGLAVTGGINGIHVRGANRASIRDCSIQNSTRNGILFSHNSEGTVDNCTVQNNGTHGISISGSSARIFNSTTSANAQNGVFVGHGGNAFIGVDSIPIPAYAGNTIANNGANGIQVVDGGVVIIGGNTISGNGTDSGSTRGRSGLGVGNKGSANLVGNNTITLNAGNGVTGTNGATILMGPTGFGLPNANTISQNNTASLPGQGGVSGFLGTSMQIFAATITGNNGHGVSLGTQSSAQVLAGTTIVGNSGRGVNAFNNASIVIQDSSITGNTSDGVFLSLRSVAQIVGGGAMAINNNTGHGISLSLGSGLFLSGPPPAPVAVTNNGVPSSGYGLLCADTESSFLGSTAGFSGNGLGGVSPGCSGF